MQKPRAHKSWVAQKSWIHPVQIMEPTLTGWYKSLKQKILTGTNHGHKNPGWYKSRTQKSWLVQIMDTNPGW